MIKHFPREQAVKFIFSISIALVIVSAQEAALAQPTTIGTETSQPVPADAMWSGVVNFRPGNGDVVTINPPLFTWSYTPSPANANADLNDKAFNFQASYSSNFTASNLVVDVFTPWNFYNFLAPFSNSPVYWRIGYIEVANTVGPPVTNGTVDTWSPVFTFTITNGTPVWDRSMLADTNYLAQKAVHPRMLINSNNIPGVTSWLAANNSPSWQALVTAANAAITNSWWTTGDPTQQYDVSAQRCQLWLMPRLSGKLPGRQRLQTPTCQPHSTPWSMFIFKITWIRKMW